MRFTMLSFHKNILLLCNFTLLVNLLVKSELLLISFKSVYIDYQIYFYCQNKKELYSSFNLQFKPILESKTIEDYYTNPQDIEVELFSQITYGNRSKLISTFSTFYESDVLGKLSNKNEVRNTENLIIVSASLSARYAVTGGAPQKSLTL